MKRSNVFNTKRPAPLDSHLYPLFKQFQDLQVEIATNWKTEVTSGLLGERQYCDLNDVRVDVGKTGAVIIRLKPMIGFDTEDEIKFYVEFFKAYKKISNRLFELLGDFTGTKSFILKSKLKRKVEDLQDFSREWKKDHNTDVHKLIMTLKILVTAVNSDKLEIHDLYRFTDVLGNDDQQGEFVASMDQFVRDIGIGNLLSDQFEKGEAHFYQYPDADLIKAYWHHATLQSTK